jgi:hypothetical protein
LEELSKNLWQIVSSTKIYRRTNMKVNNSSSIYNRLHLAASSIDLRWSRIR